MRRRKRRKRRCKFEQKMYIYIRWFARVVFGTLFYGIIHIIWRKVFRTSTKNFFKTVKAKVFDVSFFFFLSSFSIYNFCVPIFFAITRQSNEFWIFCNLKFCSIFRHYKIILEKKEKGKSILKFWNFDLISLKRYFNKKKIVNFKSLIVKCYAVKFNLKN